MKTKKENIPVIMQSPDSIMRTTLVASNVIYLYLLIYLYKNCFLGDTLYIWDNADIGSKIFVGK